MDLIEQAVEGGFGPGCKWEVEDFSGRGGLSASMQRIVVTKPDGATLKAIYKSTKVTGVEQSKLYGLAREGIFFNNVASFGETFQGDLPKVYFSSGNMETGIRTMLMEDLSETAVQAGLFFGNWSPLNTGKDLEALCSGFEEHGDMKQILQKILKSAAELVGRIHGSNWNKASLLEKPWLKNVKFYTGEGEHAYTATMQSLTKTWESTKEKMNLSDVNWSPRLVEVVDASIAKADWNNFRAKIEGMPYTLLHGDFHPANVMVSKIDLKLTLLDFEVVGIDIGAVDVGQFMISHLAPDDRRLYENTVLNHYYKSLISNMSSEEDAEKYTQEQCYSDYVRGGSEKWIFYVIILSQMVPASIMQTFHDSVLDFLVTHEVTVENVGCPRL
jgi:thiamine kinase-like enzyme